MDCAVPVSEAHVLVEGEGTFAWLNKYQRLSKGYEKWPENSEGVVSVAMIRLMPRRLAK
jgi:transposase